jgi:anti-sigma B factor antagonist
MPGSDRPDPGGPLSELPAPFRIRVDHADPRVTTLFVAGELDLSTAPDLARVLREALDAGRDVRLDLSAVDFIDSTGLAAIIQPLRRIDDDSRPVQLVGELPRQPRRLFELAGVLGTLLPLEDSGAGSSPAGAADDDAGR